ncbi:uncharacterized protein LOC104880571 [Vitis vinifera]|uniref:uncharacterized protein LOC104880571 n=1 Tax=Vitis vinifera TaxID=29760 RepID=UPI00053FAE2D|nr:uncharacterized protein LOC104880571 [Vitis vinifera]
MHYIQKCHNRILKRQGKGKGVHHPNVTSPMKVNDNGPKKLPVPPQGVSSSNIPRDNNLARRNEAFRKFLLLTELESRLSIVLSKSKQAKGSEDFSLSSSHGKMAENIKHDKSSDLDDEEGRTSFMSGGAPDKGAATNQDIGLDNH